MRAIGGALVLVATVLAGCAQQNYAAKGVQPDETTEQFVNRVINSSGGVAGF